MKDERNFKTNSLKENLDRIASKGRIDEGDMFLGTGFSKSTPIKENDGGSANALQGEIDRLIDAIHNRDTTVVDDRSLDTMSDGEILAKFILGTIQSARVKLDDPNGFSKYMKRGL
tara:strand:- start:104 stop:451 length:348 start_codon:yes stop_codon:yes gene_type:complete